jgi:hypothetical protein
MSKPRRSKKADNVLSLHGAVPAHGVPDEAMVERLRSLLSLAEAGAIHGLAYGYVGPSHEIRVDWQGSASSHELIATVAMLQRRVMTAWESGLDDD